MERHPEALRQYDEALELFHRLGLDHWRGRGLLNKGRTLLALGSASEATAVLGEAVELLRQAQDAHWHWTPQAESLLQQALACGDRPPDDPQ
jgi:hypothetical protein